MIEEKTKNNQTRKKLLGDFQTPPNLARKIMKLLLSSGVNPGAIIEPNCGTGIFITLAGEFFPGTDITGFDINPQYTKPLRQKYNFKNSNITIKTRDFFTINWKELILEQEEPVLIIGNPPWITSAEMTSLKGSNLPVKSNIHGFRGLDALTGSSNFDISEWMIIKLLEALAEGKGDLAMICKTTVARKVLQHAYRTGVPLQRASMYLIDALKYFNASVSSCLLHCRVTGESGVNSCNIFKNTGEKNPFKVMGYDNGHLIANLQDYRDSYYLVKEKNDKKHVWRSGIKHDCSKVMEFRESG
ncbi:MAG: hypothetical protein ACTSP4_13740, partial [Candidatus Hodarchaeales archaeon]